MKTKYANLIAQLERVTEAYERALEAVKTLEKTTGEQPDVFGISGGVAWYGDKFENERAIQLGANTFTPFAIDCGSDFKMEDRDEFTRFECTIFGYRVLCLAPKGSAEEALLMGLLAAEEKANE